MKKFVIAAYVVALHATAAALFYKPDLAPRVLTRVGVYPELPAHASRHKHLVFVDRLQPDGVVVFLGDSITESLAVSAVTDKTANYGIGGLTSEGLRRHAQSYTALSRASAVSIAIGVNDVSRGEAGSVAGNVKGILAVIPEGTRILLTGVFPAPNLDSAAVWSVNKQLAALCKGRAKCTYIDAGHRLAARGFYSSDGIHLNDHGYRAWVKELRVALQVHAPA